jgi:hypothetical protein
VRNPPIEWIGVESIPLRLDDLVSDIVLTTVMETNTIHPTNHAVDRFEERVLPHLPEDARARMENKKAIKRKLYDLAHRADITSTDMRMLHACAFFTVTGHAPIPLTLVIDPIKRTLVTLYIATGWEKQEKRGTVIWRWYS